MKKLLALCGFLLLGVFCANAQNPYYYYKGEKINLPLARNKVNITTTVGFQKIAVQSLDVPDFELIADNASGQNTLFGTIEFVAGLADETYQQKVAALKANPQIITVSPHFVTGDTTTIGTSSLFYVKLKQESDSALLKHYASEKNVHIVQQNYFMPLWYRLSTTAATTGTSLDMANFFYETGAFAAADPAQPTHLIGKQYQGTLELKNGAVIENALCAIALWKPGDYNTTGGILNARDAAFLNNAKSIHALHYTNFSRITLFS